MERPIYLVDPAELAGLEDGADQRLVDDRGGAAALGYQNSGQEGLPAPLGKDYCAPRRSGRQRENGKAGPGSQPLAEKVRSRASLVDFSRVQKLDPEAQGLLGRPLDLFGLVAAAVKRLLFGFAFVNNFCFGMPTPA